MDLAYEELVLLPEEFNKMYSKFKNTNKLLAWGHAQVVKRLVKRYPDCKLVVFDQFSSLKVRINEALSDLGGDIQLVQMHKGEQDIAVAGASIIARGRFVLEMEKMSQKFGMTFPKGASNAVVSAAENFIQKYGYKKLNQVAKVNFKTVERLKGTSK